jgi:predicted nucleic acid-binding Zn ribbon protein
MSRDHGKSTPEICPVCGESVPRGALACPECGADERTGWSEAARYEGLDLPDESFDYGEFVSRELEGREPRGRRRRFWWVVTVGVLILFVWMVLRLG